MLDRILERPLYLVVILALLLTAAFSAGAWLLDVVAHATPAGTANPVTVFMLSATVVASIAAIPCSMALHRHFAKAKASAEAQTNHLSAALREAGTARDSRSRMIAYLGHDLRAPLDTIVHYVHLLGSSNGQLSRHYQDVIERSVTHQLELIDELMEYTRGELEQLKLFAAPTYLHAFFQELAHQGELLAEHRGNRFKILVHDGIPAVGVIDAKRLKQVLMNLLSNASKYTESGAIRMVVELIYAPEPKMRFSVADTGVGLSEEARDGIFMPYERRTGSQPGYGLGLAIADQILRMMDSSLEVDSAAGMGSRFWFELPLEVAEEGDVLQPLQAFAIPEPFGTGKRVMIIDNNTVSRDFLNETLSLADFDVTDLSTSADAKVLLAQAHFDTVLVTQPADSQEAWQLLLHLHEQLQEHAPPVILYTALPPQRPKGLPDDLDFAEVLLKPVSANRLLQILQDMLEDVAPPAPAAPETAGTQIPEEMFAALREMIAFGNITDIMEWATAIERDYPAQADFTFALRNAALRIDIKTLSLLASRPH